MDKYVVETRTKFNKDWIASLSADVKDYDQDEFKIFVRIYAKMLWNAETEYRIVYRHEFVLGQELPRAGTWRIQTKYNENAHEEDSFFKDTPGFGCWGDINVMKAAGYSSYDEAFNALKNFGFEEANPTFVWRIVQD